MSRRAAGLAMLALALARPAAAQQRGERVGAERHSTISVAAARIAPSVVSVNVVGRERALPNDFFSQFMSPGGSSSASRGSAPGSS